MTGRLAAGLLRVVRDEPVLLLGAGSATGTVLAFLGIDKAVLGMLGALLSALLLLARGVVTPVGKVEAVATSAAATAVSALDEGTIGAVGDITETAADAITSAVTGTLATVGIKPRRRRARR